MSEQFELFDEALNEIKHRRMVLKSPKQDEDHPHRPGVAVWADFDQELGGEQVVLMIDRLWGQQARYISLSPDEARKFAAMINQTATAVEHAVSSVKAGTYEKAAS